MTDGAGGTFLFLFESFAARAMLGSLVAALLVAYALRRNVVRGVTGRRVLMTTPFALAAVLALVSANRGFLPVLEVGAPGGSPAADPTGRSVGALVDVLGDLQTIGGHVDLLVAAYLAVVAALLGRRMLGVLASRRLRTSSEPAGPDLRRRTARIAALTGVEPPDVRLRRDCPGGALTAGVRRPWIALDVALADALDEREVDALLAHEMAHIRRRDPLFCLLTGICRDLLFFLPGVHIATMWIRREQEEDADDLAARSTRRPGALASTILKVWEAQTVRRRVVHACQAVGVTASGRVLPALRRARQPERPHVLVRVERLITAADRGEAGWRRDAGVPLAVLAVAVTLGVGVPAALTQAVGDHGVLLRVAAAPQTANVESPAFATFRALAPAQPEPSTVAEPVPGADADPLCPCVESPAQLRAGRSAAAAPHSQLVWSNDGRDAWELRGRYEQARLRVNRELLSRHVGSQEVEFLTVSRTGTVR